MASPELPSAAQLSHAPSSAKAATPLMQQYLSIKARHPEEFLFFRLGDFYELFFEDAVKGAPLLEVTLTQRQGIPMCGIPYHASTAYIAKLLKHGHAIAIAEQLEDPKNTKGMVKRDVVRIVTPGTITEDELLEAKANNFLAALAVAPSKGTAGGAWALAAADVSTGRQWVAGAEDDVRWNALKARLASLDPSELLMVGESAALGADFTTGRSNVRCETVPPGETTLQSQALAAIRVYLERDHSRAAAGLQPPLELAVGSGRIMFLDETALRHLELVHPADPLNPGPTLLSVLDQCATPLGSRLMRWWLLHPSNEKHEIERRLDCVESFLANGAIRSEFRRLLHDFCDLERVSVRAQSGTASPRDMAALRHSLEKCPLIREILRNLDGGAPVPSEGSPAVPSVTEKSAYGELPLTGTPGFPGGRFSALLQGIQVPEALVALLAGQLAEDPPSKLQDGGVIREGVSLELDELRSLRRSGKTWIAALETSERERTGIGSLKIGYNDVFGYYLEASRAQLTKVPPDWIRKQTLANGERYVTPALKEQEEKILGAEERIAALEARLFAELVHQVAAHGPSLARLADAVAQLDSFASLAQVALENGYVRPRLLESDELQIAGGRHPVIERSIGRDRFIPNDCHFDRPAKRIAIITGPNMAGKSTYLRQTALIVLMAQMGSYVPADSASIGLVDKIFTRIGASDRLSQGQSTFMVEMQEVAALLLNATSKSLLILDEVGRGTSTYDGVSIAWAVIEHLSGPQAGSPRALFATHYFELTALPEKLQGVFNLHATAKEWPGPDGRRQVVFLYQILAGAADRSYGIHVAEMAGLPASCVERAREILEQLETGAVPVKGDRGGLMRPDQLELFSGQAVIDELRGLPLDGLTPLQALNRLAELKEKLKHY